MAARRWSASFRERGIVAVPAWAARFGQQELAALADWAAPYLESVGPDEPINRTAASARMVFMAFSFDRLSDLLVLGIEAICR